MAQLGVRKIEDLIGRADLIDTRRAITHYKAKGLDFSKLLYKPQVGPEIMISNRARQDHGLEKALDHSLIAKAASALADGQAVNFESPIRNVNRTVGAMLSGEVAMRYGHA